MATRTGRQQAHSHGRSGGWFDFELVRDESGGRGKGGMASKLEAARICNRAGENVIIACGRDPGGAFQSPRRRNGRHPIPRARPVAGRPQALDRVYREPAGVLNSMPGPRQAIQRKGRSLLAAGMVEVIGHFPKETSWLFSARRSRDRPRLDELRSRGPGPDQRAPDGPDRQHLGRMPLPGSHASRQHGGYHPGGVNLGVREFLLPRFSCRGAAFFPACVVR